MLQAVMSMPRCPANQLANGTEALLKMEKGYWKTIVVSLVTTDLNNRVGIRVIITQFESPKCWFFRTCVNLSHSCH